MPSTDCFNCLLEDDMKDKKTKVCTKNQIVRFAGKFFYYFYVAFCGEDSRLVIINKKLRISQLLTYFNSVQNSLLVA